MKHMNSHEEALLENVRKAYRIARNTIYTYGPKEYDKMSPILGSMDHLDNNIQLLETEVKRIKKAP